MARRVLVVLGEGFDRGYDMLMYGQRVGLVELRSTSYRFQDKALGQGKRNAARAMFELGGEFEEALNARQKEND